LGLRGLFWGEVYLNLYLYELFSGNCLWSKYVCTQPSEMAVG